jgi:hypothetical protein
MGSIGAWRPAFRIGSMRIAQIAPLAESVDGEEPAVRAIKRLGELDRRKIRARFERRFSAARMADEYVRHYHGAAARP